MKHTSIVFSALLLAMANLFAQQGVEAAPAAAAGGGPDSFLSILMKGGTVMIPLALLSFTAVVLIMFYLLTIRKGAVVSNKFMNAADALIRKQDYLGLIAVCNRQGESIARITFKTLDFATKNPTANFQEVREIAEAEGSRQASILNGRISYLADVGSIAPMVGLLGTVIGMIRAFEDIGVGVGQMELAPGVSQALITTASGLVIGIPSLIFYSLFFRGKVQKLIAELEAATTHLMALLSAQYKRTAPRQKTEKGAAAEQASEAQQPGQRDFESIGADFPLGGARDEPQGL